MHPLSLAAAAGEQIQAIDKEEPVSGLQTMEDAISRSVGERRFNMLLITVFAAVALALAAVGIYGVVSYSATQRTHEIGIRMALGASRGDVLRLVVSQSAALTLIGVVLGTSGALAATRIMSRLLFGTQPTDTFTFAAVSLVIGASSMLAS